MESPPPQPKEMRESKSRKESSAQLTSVDCTMNVMGLKPNRFLGNIEFGLTTHGPFNLTLEGLGLFGKDYHSYLAKVEIEIDY